MLDASGDERRLRGGPGQWYAGHEVLPLGRGELVVELDESGSPSRVVRRARAEVVPATEDADRATDEGVFEERGRLPAVAAPDGPHGLQRGLIRLLACALRPPHEVHVGAADLGHGREEILGRDEPVDGLPSRTDIEVQ